MPKVCDKNQQSLTNKAKNNARLDNLTILIKTKQILFGLVFLAFFLQKWYHLGFVIMTQIT